jgi:integrase
MWRPGAQCYDLRHAFASAFHTSSDFDHIDIEELCRFMGHSKKIHETHYKRWLDKKKLKAQAARRFRNR